MMNSCQKTKITANVTQQISLNETFKCWCVNDLHSDTWKPAQSSEVWEVRPTVGQLLSQNTSGASRGPLQHHKPAESRDVGDTDAWEGHL